MSLLSKLFGGGDKAAAKEAEPENYKGFNIFAEPISEGGQFRVAARIEKEIDGDLKTHQLIRADLINNRDEATTASTNKAKQIIDEQGDRLFG